MRVIRTINDTIRLLFNPKTESLRLGDFLLVREGVNNFLGQITEIYDNKYNHEENVAKIKLIFRVGENNEILPYDNFTPSRECEIAKIKQNEIEKFIATGKKTFKVGLNTKSEKAFECPVDFFNNNPVIFADKSDESNCAFENLAPKLSKLSKVVVIDFTGSLNIKGAAKISAIEDFKLPLDFDSLDYIWEKGLAQAKLETQAVLEDIFNELKCFVKESDEKYISFPKFIKVVESQYKQTPIVELKVLANRMKKYYIQGLFAKSKKEFDTLEKCILKNDITVVDLSNLKVEWMKDFLDYVIKQIDEKAYLMLRLNESNSNADIINLLYTKKANLNVVSSLSYGFKNMPKVMEFARNYILYQTFNPRRDFGFANFWAQSIDASSCVLFGEDTKNFMFSIKNANFDETKKPENKEKLFIELDLELEEMTPVELEGSNFEFKNVHIQPRLKEEVELEEALSDDSVHSYKISNADNQADSEYHKGDTEEAYNATDVQSEDILPAEIEPMMGPLGEDELDFYENQDTVLETVTDIPFEDIETEISEAEIANDKSQEEIPADHQLIETEVCEENVEDNIETLDANKDVLPEEGSLSPEEEIFAEENLQIEEELTSEDEDEYTLAVTDESFRDEEPDAQLEESVLDAYDAVSQDVENSLTPEKDPAYEPIIIVNEKPILQIEDYTYEEEPVDSVQSEENEAYSTEDRVLETETEEFETTENPEDIVAENAPESFVTDENLVETTETTENQGEDSFSLSEIAKKSIETRFDEVIDEAGKMSSKNKLKISENVSIDLEKIKNNIDSNETTLPIFKMETDDAKDYNYSDGEAVIHEKYGEGTILKVVKYSNRCLLQIEFKEVGKKLLDPKIAHIKPVKED